MMSQTLQNAFCQLLKDMPELVALQVERMIAKDKVVTSKEKGEPMPPFTVFWSVESTARSSFYCSWDKNLHYLLNLNNGEQSG